MSRKTKAWLFVIIILVVLIGGVFLFWEVTHGNRQLVDFKNRFDRAYITLPNGEYIEGKVSSWTDFADSDVVQVTIDGKTYLTSYVNVILIDD